MAGNDKPGTNPPAGGPQGGASGNDPKGGEKLIAGKFKTVEEAVEQGYIGLEKGYHDLGEKVAALTTLLESALTPDPNNPGQPPVDQGGGGDHGAGDPYGRGGTVDAADFLSNPSKHLDERDAKLEKRLVQVVTSAIGNANAVSDFKRQNPDLVQHEKIVKAFMPETDARKPVNVRLEEAGKLAREYLAKVKSDGTDGGAKPPTGDNYVETPRGGNPPPASQPDKPSEADEERELADYIRERQERMSSHFGAPEQK